MSQPGALITQNLNSEPFDYGDIDTLMSDKNNIPATFASPSNFAENSVIERRTSASATPIKTNRDIKSPEYSFDQTDDDQNLEQYIARIKRLNSSASQSTPTQLPSPSPTNYDGVPFDWNRTATPIDKEAAEANHALMLDFIKSHPDWFEKFSRKNSDSKAEVQNRISALIRCYCLKDTDSFEKNGGLSDEYELCATIDLQAKSNSKKAKKSLLPTLTPYDAPCPPPTLSGFITISEPDTQSAFQSSAQSSASSIASTPTFTNSPSTASIQVSPIKVSTPKSDNTDSLYNSLYNPTFLIFKEQRGTSLSPLPPSSADFPKVTVNSPSKAHSPSSAFVAK